MNWKYKALVQNTIARLPSSVSYDLYYRVQRTVGGLRRLNPTSRLRAGLEVVKRIEAQGRSIVGATLFEVGTGRRVALPLALWLAGAQQIITVDLNPYLEAELVFLDITYMREHREAMSTLFAAYWHDPAFQARFESLVHVTPADGIRAVLDLTGITYLAPADATQVMLADRTIDFHISYTVLEHIPPAVIQAIMVEGRRILKPDGLFVHCIDFTDHFAHSDKQITTVNFLQFSEAAWERYAGNRYMYHNRLRIDEFEQLILASGLAIRTLEHDLNQRSLRLLEQGGIPLDARFAGKPPAINAAASAWVTATPDTAERAKQ